MPIKIVAVYNVEADSEDELKRIAEAYGAESVEVETPVDAATYLVNTASTENVSRVHQVSVRVEETDAYDMF